MTLFCKKNVSSAKLNTIIVSTSPYLDKVLSFSHSTINKVIVKPFPRNGQFTLRVCVLEDKTATITMKKSGIKMPGETAETEHECVLGTFANKEDAVLALESLREKMTYAKPKKILCWSVKIVVLVVALVVTLSVVRTVVSAFEAVSMEQKLATAQQPLRQQSYTPPQYTLPPIQQSQPQFQPQVPLAQQPYPTNLPVVPNPPVLEGQSINDIFRKAK